MKSRDLHAAKLKNIGLTKLSTLAARGSKKDFIDLYLLLKEIPIKILLKYGEKKLKNQRDFQIQVLKALVYFDDAENEPMPLMHKKVTWEKIKQFFTRETRTLVNSLW